MTPKMIMFEMDTGESRSLLDSNSATNDNVTRKNLRLMKNESSRDFF